jgi:CPA2 family monovalent cation:H+ antiporter-2
VHPVRDVFAAIFFVSVGMLIDPALVARHWPAVAVLAAVVVAGKILSVTVGAFLTGNGTRTSLQAGMSLAQIGEFSFIIAGLGLALSATDEALYAVAVAVSALTTLTTPWLIRAAGPVANWVDRKLPRPVQTFAALYGSWVESLSAAPRSDTARAKVRRLVRLLLLDTALIAGIVAGSSLWADEIAAFAARNLGISPGTSAVLVVATAAVLCAPFCLGVVRVARKLGTTLASVAFPAAEGARPDLAAAPRRALVVTLQLAALLLAAVLLLAVTQPFVPGWEEGVVMLALLVVLGAAFWRRATDLQGHVRAGAQLIAEALAAQARRGAAEPSDPSLEAARALVPGLGEPTPVRLDPDSPAVGRTLADLNLRGVTGATVLAILRGDEGAVVPSASERLCAGDVLALAGTHEAVGAATALLAVGRGASGA